MRNDYEPNPNCTCPDCSRGEYCPACEDFGCNIVSSIQPMKTKKEILKKVIEKAVKNGYTDWGMPRGFAVYSVIFSHDFAKAFWGEDHDFLATGTWNQECRNCHRTKTIGECLKYSCWQYGLLGMVLEENPITYLSKFL